MIFIVVGPDTDISFVMRSKRPLEDTQSSDSTAWWTKIRKPEDRPQLRHHLCAKPKYCSNPIQILLLRPKACDPNTVLS